ncbi:MAG: DUF3098 domain-containing protein [Saprospiraceae bacterium]|nr:DUF3098 domain-containing protein [Saprospiraceae bacterium]
MSKKKKEVPSRGTRAQETSRKVVVTSSSKAQEAKATESKTTTYNSPRASKVESEKETLLFRTSNYAWMLLGAGLVALGMLLMSGGAMPDPNTWDPNIIYSTRRTVLAPIAILLGLAVEVYAIFKR